MIQKPQTGDQEYVRRLNRSIVLNHIKEYGPISRAEIAKDTSLNKATVSSLVEQLINENLVKEIGAGHSSGGRRPVLLLFNAEAGSVIGVDLGVNYILVVLTNLSSHIKWSKKVFLSPAEDFQSVLDKLYKLIGEAIEHAPQTPHGILGIGVGIPAITDHQRGIVLFAPNLQWKDVNLKDLLEQRFSLPVVIDNEANMGALGEKMFGNGAGYQHIAYISVGIGIGVGLVLDNQVYRGANGFAGEMGHMIIEKNGLKCSCGNRGCWEMYASEKSLYMRMEEIQFPLSSTDPLQSILQAAETGHHQVIASLHDIGEYLGIGISNIINAFNPDCVIIGNTLSQADRWIIAPIEKVINSRTLPFSRQHVQVKLSNLGDKACVIGAVSSILTQHFSFNGTQMAVPNP
ncbi:glucokinase-like ROK family protein [Caldalkalibacillus uzonensis]|uniref:Glucokinase-like ROK family protein n=1 Tax=Caldalkalibacillus uzonensis TaxID=353224 RepID=A0ABU0CQB2_9BACI|nr:ROK family transcriptional regulator [Caldalkalibacillus uzonensis]MDQ0338604.1 glucokinase-like ROK family protein [Caldalkalibacillus uzonensis]